jgi:hypothetical protein
VYTLLFSATGLSVWQISSLFVIWSLSSMAFEVPSGAWADATSRRLSSHDDRSGWTDALRSGLGEARRSPKIMVAVILVAVVASVWGALDEYTPLLIGSIGVDTVDVSLLMVVIWAGAATGGLLAGRAARLGTRSLAWLLCCGAALMTTGALSDHPAGVVPLAAAFGVFQLVTVVADARLQDSISGPARATVTSLAGMSTDVVTLVVYGSYAALAEIGGHADAFAILMLPYVLVAVILATSRWRRAASRDR